GEVALVAEVVPWPLEEPQLSRPWRRRVAADLRGAVRAERVHDHDLVRPRHRGEAAGDGSLLVARDREDRERASHGVTPRSRRGAWRSRSSRGPPPRAARP